MKTIIKVLINYSIFLICVVGFPAGGVLYLMLPMIQIGISAINYRNSEKWQTVLMLQIHLLISTILGIYFEGYLFLKYISNDAESFLIIAVVMKIGVILVCILGIITTLIKYISIKINARKQKN